MYVPNVSVDIEIKSILGVKLAEKTEGGTVNFDVKARLEEKERRSQMVKVGFRLFLTTKPSLVKFEIEGVATLKGKDANINEMLEVDPETKVPYVFHKVYQQTFTAMYLLSTMLNAPSPPSDLLFSSKHGEPVGDVSVESEATDAEVVSGEPEMQVAAEAENVEAKQ
ncbi:hypothetical protein DRO45_03050 [Candidatus Bathyarchaeota archaeon]|nr:MAG: hypothetical protein DRO45_03050 [Candidatus Bathyarchaeota archaeon]